LTDRRTGKLVYVNVHDCLAGLYPSLRYAMQKTYYTCTKKPGPINHALIPLSFSCSSAVNEPKISANSGLAACCRKKSSK